MGRVQDYTQEKEAEVYKDMFGALPQSMFLLDKNRIVIGVFNAAEEALAGVALEDIVGKSIMVFADDPSSPFYQACSMLNSTFDSVFTTGVPLTFQYVILDNVFEATITKIPGERILSQVRDISEIATKQRDIEAEKHNELSMALMAGGLTWWNYDVKSRMLTSKQGNKIIGNAILLDDLLASLKPEYSKMTVDMFDDIQYRGCTHSQMTMQALDCDGVVQWVEVHAIPLGYALDGSVSIIVGSQKEVTQEYEYNEELRKLISKNELILNNTNSGFVYLTGELKVEWENVSTVFTDPEIICLFNNGRLCDDVCARAAKCNRGVILRAHETHETASGKYCTSSGVVVESFAQPVRGQNGEVEGIVLRMEDISDKERAVRELAEAKERAEQSDKLKSAFLANMSHEIRTPLNAIVGFANLIPDAACEEDRRDYIDVVNSNSEVLLKLINDILDLSKIEAGYFTCNDVVFDLQALFSELEMLFSQKIPEGVELICQTSDTECLVNLDRVRVLQILSNFMTNAIKFTKKGHIRMGFKLQADGVCLFVEDTGCGMNKDEMSRVFQRFEKFNIFEQGTGLGMSIAKAVVDAYRGRIGVESEPEKGSTFWAVIPAGVASPEKVFCAVASAPEEGRKIADLSRASVRVLVAEDNDSNYLLIKTLLREFNLTRACNGQEAVEFARSQEFDLVLMDIRMPVMDGLEATRNIREFNKHLPIIAVTANAFDEDRRQAFDAGVDEFLTKPLRKDILLTTINKF